VSGRVALAAAAALAAMALLAVAANPLAVAANPLAAAAPSPRSAEPTCERSIERASPGRVVVRLDRGVYESARADLGDLRVVDERGVQVPFLIDRGQAESPQLGDLRPKVRNRAWRSDGASVAVLDFGGRLVKQRLRLALSGQNFRRRVAVEGSDDQVRWKTIVDEAWVFAVPAREPARYETLELPENDFPFLRVTVHPGPDERERIAIADARVPAEGRPPLREDVLTPRWTRAEDVKDAETWLVLELGARHQPFHAIDLDVADARFFREALVEARRERSGAGAPALDWVELGRGAIYRLEHEGRLRECLRVPVCGRERVLRVRLRNRDDRPLPIRGVSVRVPIERLVFEAAPERSYLLRYGSRDLPSASFDLERTVGDVAAWAAAAREGGLGAERVAYPVEDLRVPWSERHPSLLWAGLIAVVAALGALTYRALRRV
jgi:hypothetical protein